MCYITMEMSLHTFINLCNYRKLYFHCISIHYFVFTALDNLQHSYLNINFIGTFKAMRRVFKPSSKNNSSVPMNSFCFNRNISTKGSLFNVLLKHRLLCSRTVMPFFYILLQKIKFIF